jgi:hypothetical protein
MPIKFRQVSIFLMILGATAGSASAQAMGMTLLSVAAQVEAEPEATPPTASEALEATRRIMTIWPALVGKLPADEPRYNWEDVGHVARSIGLGALARPVGERRMVKAFKDCGLTPPENALTWPKDGTTRVADRDDNGGAERNVTRDQLEAMQGDSDVVKAYFASVEKSTGVKLPRNPNGMSMKDWQRVQTLLKTASFFGGKPKAKAP